MTSFTEGFFCSFAGGGAFELSAACSAALFACFVPGLGPPRASLFFLGPIIVVYIIEYKTSARGVNYAVRTWGKKVSEYLQLWFRAIPL